MLEINLIIPVKVKLLIRKTQANDGTLGFFKRMNYIKVGLRGKNTQKLVVLNERKLLTSDVFIGCEIEFNDRKVFLDCPFFFGNI